MLYIFRVEEGVSNKQLDEEGRKALVHELKDGRLRQGWGINGMALLNKRGSAYTLEKWTENFRKAASDWGSEERAAKKVKMHYDLLAHMLAVREGDRLVVPNVAEQGRKGFVIATAVRNPERPPNELGECYGFSSSLPRALNGDRRHYVSVDPVMSEFISYDSSAEAAALPMLLKNGGFFVRMRPVEAGKHPKLVRSIERLSGRTDESAPARTLKNVRVGTAPGPDQKKRGLEGEKEIMRRLAEEDLGLTLVKDRTKDGCGYDFLCTDGKRNIELEVKSYEALTGQIFFTPKELEQALKSKDRYRLWALLDNGGDPKTWELRTLQAPHGELKRVGQEQVHIVLRIRPQEVRWESTTGSPAKGRDKQPHK